jgi:hypothetical protein
MRIDGPRRTAGSGGVRSRPLLADSDRWQGGLDAARRRVAAGILRTTHIGALKRYLPNRYTKCQT